MPSMQIPATKKKDDTPELERSLNLTLLVLYGLGTTIGAGIYVLVGAAAGSAGYYAPISFLLAAVALIPTAASYAELSGRLPVSAGETAYVNEGFDKKWLSKMVGWLVIGSGMVACATIAIGCAGYLRTFVDFPFSYILVLIILLIGLIASWGIMESVLFASLLTIIEVAGLILIVIYGYQEGHLEIESFSQLFPITTDLVVWTGVIHAGMFAVFAFIGFEDMVNVAEETKRPKRTLPWAIFITLGITALLYFLVTLVAVQTITPELLSSSEAPLSDVYTQLTGYSPILISGIAVFATMNTILVQYIMVSRVMYGMAKQGTMPSVFGRVNSITKTPVFATAIVVFITLVLALLFPLEKLAALTSQFIIVVWMLVNGSLVLIKWRRHKTTEAVFAVPLIVPIIGVVLSILLILFSWFV